MGGGIDSRCVGRVSGLEGAPSAPYTRPTQRLSRPPSIQELGAENLTSTAPDDGGMRPKHVELRIHQ